MVEERIQFTDGFHNLGGSVSWVRNCRHPQTLYIQWYTNQGGTATTFYNDSNGRPYPIAQRIGDHGLAD